MNLEHSQTALDSRQAGRAAFTIMEFCDAHRISRAKLYQLWAVGVGPRVIQIGIKKIISNEAAADWRREREAESAVA